MADDTATAPQQNPPTKGPAAGIAPGHAGPARGTTVAKTDFAAVRFAAMNLVGVGLLIWTAQWWAACVAENRVSPVPVRWFDPYTTLGVDFEHNYRAANLWLAGGNPYREPFGDPLARKLCYPPIVTLLFAWCGLFDYPTALGIWTFALGAFVAAGAVAACRTRRELGLEPVPAALAAALVLNCSPVLFAMERGNYDILVLPLLLFAAWSLRGKAVRCDVLAGCFLALAAAIKVYPGLLVVGLLPLRRFRAFGFATAFGLAFAAYQPHNIPPFLDNLRELSAQQTIQSPKDFVGHASHSFTQSWPALWVDSPLSVLGRVPPLVAVAAIFGPLLVAVGYRIARCPDPRPVTYAYFLWLAALATFVPGVSNDYNLFFLPLAAVAVWDARDPLPVSAALALVLLWLQPVNFGIASNLVFAFKLAGVVALAVSLDRRVREAATVALPSKTEPDDFQQE